MKPRLISFLLLIFMISACDLTGSNNEPKVSEKFDVHEIELTINESYVHNLGSFGDEEYATILRDPEFAEQNELVYPPEDPFTLNYLYTPEENFTGKDYVIIESKRGSDGQSRNDEILFTILKFTIHAE